MDRGKPPLVCRGPARGSRWSRKGSGWSGDCPETPVTLTASPSDSSLSATSGPVWLSSYGRSFVPTLPLSPSFSSGPPLHPLPVPRPSALVPLSRSEPRALPGKSGRQGVGQRPPEEASGTVEHPGKAVQRAAVALPLLWPLPLLRTSRCLQTRTSTCRNWQGAGGTARVRTVGASSTAARVRGREA